MEVSDTMRTMTILVIEPANASAPSRSFTTHLHDNGEVVIDDLDNMMSFPAGTPGANMLAALISPSRAALDFDLIQPEYFGASSIDLDLVGGPLAAVAPVPDSTTTVVTTVTTQVRGHRTPAVHPGWLARAQP